MYNLADLLQTKGDLEAAEPLFRRELAICEVAHGDDHADTGASARNLADLLEEKGEPEKAEELRSKYARAIEAAEAGEESDEESGDSEGEV